MLYNLTFIKKFVTNCVGLCIYSTVFKNIDHLLCASTVVDTWEDNVQASWSLQSSGREGKISKKTENVWIQGVVLLWRKS